MRTLSFSPYLVPVVGALLLLGACSNAAAKPAPASPPPSPTPLAVRLVSTPLPEATAVTATATPPRSRSPARATIPTALPSTTPSPAQESAAPDGPVATPVATSPGCGDLSRLMLPSIGVNAGFVTLGLLPDTRQMDAPKTPTDVGCYALDGYDGSNLVLGGHVDWFTHQPGVFWDLRKLQPGDEAQLSLRDGSTVRFRVTASQVYEATTPQVGEIVANTSVPTLTLITCDGEFNPITGEYNKSRVVRAEKIDQ